MQCLFALYKGVIVKEYEKHLREIEYKLDLAIAEIDKALDAGEKDIESMQEYYWLNYTEMDEYGYENYDNQQALLLQAKTNEQQLILKRRYLKLKDSPYFGRVDFVYEGDDAAEVFYIGIGNFSEKKGMPPVIYDWRAPVSSLFYDYDSGKASYMAPAGELSGEIKGKGQYKIRAGRLVYAFESDVKIDDEVLARELAGKGQTSLKNIIQTIQREQNVIIRNTKDRILVIQGVAGSGKTSVALHRIAYLLYHNRESLKSKNVLILSPNGIFADYISHILPELGEENILEMSFDTFAYRELKKVAADTEDKSQYLERLLLNRADRDSYEYKQSSEFADALFGYVLELEDTLFESRDIKLKGYFKAARELEMLFYNKFTALPIIPRLEAVKEYVKDEYETLVNRNLHDDESVYFDELFGKMLRQRDVYVLYSEFLKALGYEPLVIKEIQERYIMSEDVYPMLYLKYLLEGHKEHKQIKHLVIDEMQDYSYLQYRILGTLFKCQMTILGDKAQMLDGEPVEVLPFIRENFGKDIKYIELDKSYRNTVEIADFAARLSGLSKDDIDVFERHGTKVGECEAASIDSAAEIIAKYIDNDTETETAAVITFTQEMADNIYQELKKKLSDKGEDSETRLTLINSDSRHFKTGVLVIPYYLAKGLEFERVYLVDESKCIGVIYNQARYIACTRALHGLYRIMV